MQNSYYTLGTVFGKLCPGSLPMAMLGGTYHVL